MYSCKLVMCPAIFTSSDSSKVADVSVTLLWTTDVQVCCFTHMCVKQTASHLCFYVHVYLSVWFVRMHNRMCAQIQTHIHTHTRTHIHTHTRTHIHTHTHTHTHTCTHTLLLRAGEIMFITSGLLKELPKCLIGTSKYECASALGEEVSAWFKERCG